MLTSQRIEGPPSRALVVHPADGAAREERTRVVQLLGSGELTHVQARLGEVDAVVAISVGESATQAVGGGREASGDGWQVAPGRGTALAPVAPVVPSP